MDNKQIASILYETADLLEIAGEDAFRIRSYRRAAESIDVWPVPLPALRHDEKAILAIPGIGKGMLSNLRDIFNTGEMSLHRELLQRFKPSMLELLQIPGLGPKTIALIWDAFQISDLAGVEQLARDGKLQSLPRLSAKTEQKILKGIADYRQRSGRFLLDVAERTADQLVERLAALPGVEKVTPAGSLRRGRETVGDLDLLVTGACCRDPQQLAAVIDSVVTFPGITEVLAKGENKVSFKLRGGMQVDVRLLPPESFGAAMQYFTGSKSHNVTLRQRALKLGYTLNEYGLAQVDEPDVAPAPSPAVARTPSSAPAVISKNSIIASATEEEIYSALGLDYIAPELRENCGEIDAAAKHQLPTLITEADIRGDVHAHTTETDGRNSIAEMAVAARAKGYAYCAITDHSKNLAMTNGMDDQRALAHIQRIREANRQTEGIRILAGIECDILADGSLDLSDGVLDQMDMVIGSVHSHFNQSPEEMTKRLLRALSTGKIHILGHPFGRKLLQRDGYSFDLHAVCNAARQHRVAVEHNANPHRLDLSDVNLRIAKSLGVKIVINTDAHSTSDYGKMKYGITQLRRAWLTKEDVLNTLPLDAFLKAIAK